MTHAWNRPVLRPRTLAVDLFARALEGDANAEDHLRLLTVADPVAQRAHEALVVADLELLHRAAPSAHGLPAMDMALIERVLANLETAHDNPHPGGRRGELAALPRRAAPADAAGVLEPSAQAARRVVATSATPAPRWCGAPADCRCPDIASAGGGRGHRCVSSGDRAGQDDIGGHQ